MLLGWLTGSAEPNGYLLRNGESVDTAIRFPLFNNVSQRSLRNKPAIHRKWSHYSTWQATLVDMDMRALTCGRRPGYYHEPDTALE